MASLWMDHFGQYYSTTDMLDGAWAEVDSDWALSTANPPRAGASHMRLPSTSTGSMMRRTLTAAKTAAGMASRIYVDKLPGAEPETDSFPHLCAMAIRQWRNGVNNTQLTLILGTDGAFALYAGSWSAGAWAAHRLARSAQCVFPKNYHHIEDKITVNAASGSYELRVDGVTRINLSGINTDIQATGDVSQVAFGSFGTVVLGEMLCTLDWADTHAWDAAAGEGLTAFGGNLGVIQRALAADTADAGWSLSTGSAGFSLLNDKSDSTYIEADSTTLKSGFTAAALASGTTGIVAQQIMFRGLKTDAGDCSVAPSFKSSGSESSVTGQPMTTGEAWRWGIVGKDPATSAPWTRTGANASEACVTRTL